ncbi:MAG: hypothetical protein WDN04_25500 [Rhodospirillales bacterium]
MPALKALVIFMGVLIVAGMALIAVTLARRGAAPPPTMADLTLSEPAGSHIAMISAVGPRLAVLLQGGGPDRITIIDADGRVVGRLKLAK